MRGSVCMIRLKRLGGSSYFSSGIHCVGDGTECLGALVIKMMVVTVGVMFRANMG